MQNRGEWSSYQRFYIVHFRLVLVKQMKKSEHEDILYLQNAVIQWIPRRLSDVLKTAFQSIKHNDDFQFPAVVFVVQKET